MHWLGHWKYTILLTALVGTILIAPSLEGGSGIVYHGVATLVFLAAGLVLFQRRESRLAAVILGLSCLATILADRFAPAVLPGVANNLFHVFSAFFFGHVVITILRSVFRHPTVTMDSINGAFCGYMLIGLVFGHLYCLVESFVPQSFHLDESVGALPDYGVHRQLILTYYSLMTLTTVGYGDIWPQSSPARSVAIIEAVIGQFYVAVIVAQLISLKVAAALENRSNHHSQT